ncbi:hypothetical protein ACKKBG_A15745 [Auxenochlorella protothecoides x Auxenochlorella symbiontica]
MLSVELARYAPSIRGSTAIADMAIQIFQSAFKPVPLDDGRDLLTLVCHSYQTPPAPPNGKQSHTEEYDFSNFRLFVLRKGANVACVATVRVCGDKFAEVPFVATREGYRRAGLCKVLIKELRGMLAELGVRFLVLPAVESVCDMWCTNFGFVPLRPLDAEVLEERVIMPDGATLLCKPCDERAKGAPYAPRQAATTGTPGGKRRAAAGLPRAAGPKKRRGARFTKRIRRGRPASAPTYREMSDSDEGADESEEEGFDPERDASCAEESESEGEGALEAEAPDDTAVAAVGAVRRALQQGSAGAHVPPPVGPGAPPGVAPATKPSAHPGTGLPPRAPRAPAPPGSEGHREGALTTSRPGSKPPADCTCSTCGTRDAKRWVRVSADQTGVPAGETAPEGGGDSEAQAPRDGGWECPVCARYRRDHKGQPRPSRLWLKTGAGRGAGGKPAPPLPAKPKPGAGMPTAAAPHATRIPPLVILELRRLRRSAAEREAQQKLHRHTVALALASTVAGYIEEAVLKCMPAHAARTAPNSTKESLELTGVCPVGGHPPHFEVGTAVEQNSIGRNVAGTRAQHLPQACGSSGGKSLGPLDSLFSMLVCTERTASEE